MIEVGLPLYFLGSFLAVRHLNFSIASTAWIVCDVVSCSETFKFNDCLACLDYS